MHATIEKFNLRKMVEELNGILYESFLIYSYHDISISSMHCYRKTTEFNSPCLTISLQTSVKSVSCDLWDDGVGVGDGDGDGDDGEEGEDWGYVIYRKERPN